MMARIYSTDLWEIKKEWVVKYNDLKRIWRRIPEKVGTAYWNNVYVLEVWTDSGDDGHIAYKLRGFIIISSADLEGLDISNAEYWQVLDRLDPYLW